MPSQLAMRLSFASRRDFFLISSLKKRPTFRLPLRGISRSSFRPVCRPVITPRTVITSRKRTHDGYQRGWHQPQQTPQVINAVIASWSRPWWLSRRLSQVETVPCICIYGYLNLEQNLDGYLDGYPKHIVAIAHCRPNLTSSLKTTMRHFYCQISHFCFYWVQSDNIDCHNLEKNGT